MWVMGDDGGLAPGLALGLAGGIYGSLAFSPRIFQHAERTWQEVGPLRCHDGRRRSGAPWNLLSRPSASSSVLVIASNSGQLCLSRPIAISSDFDNILSQVALCDWRTAI